MPKLILFALLLTATLGALATPMGASLARSTAEGGGGLDSLPFVQPARSGEAALDVCVRPNVAVDTVTPTLGGISQAEAEAEASGIGVVESPSVATRARVTIGINVGVAPGSQIRPDLSGNLIASRPVWILVYRNQQLLLPGGGVPAKKAVSETPRKHAYATAVATIIDAETGRLIYGWTCQVTNR